MANNLKSFLKSFSFLPTLRTNLSTPPSIPGVNSSPRSSMAEPTALVSDRKMSTFFLRLQELENYEMTELTENIVGLFIDYIGSYIKDDLTAPITLTADVPEADERSEKINKVLKDIRFISDMRLHLWDYIYFGSYSFRLDWDPLERKFSKKLLRQPSKVVAKYSNDGLLGYLVPSKLGVIHEVTPNSIIMLGSPNLTLWDDMSDEAKNDLADNVFSDDEKEKNDTLLGDVEYRGCKPLYYTVIGKVKEYLLKDQLINLLGIKDLIQPLVYCMSFENSTPPDEAAQLTQNIENLINKYSDVSVVIESNFDLNALLDSINNNLKIVCDYNQEAQNLNALDLLKVTDRLSELRGDQDNVKGAILQACGVPEGLFTGESTKWDSIKASQRLSSKVAYYLEGIENSIKNATCNIYKYIYDDNLDPDHIKINILAATEVDYNNTINQAEMTVGAMDAITGILDKFATMLESYGDMVDKEKLGEFIVGQAQTVMPSCSGWFNTDTIKERIKNSDMQAEQDEFGEMGGDMMGGGMDMGIEPGGDMGMEDLGDEGLGEISPDEEIGGEDLGEIM